MRFVSWSDMRRAAIESVTAEQQAQINLEEARRALATAPAGTSGWSSAN
jgi:hypothetical protein